MKPFVTGFAIGCVGFAVCEVLGAFLLSLFIVGGCHGPRPVLRFSIRCLDQERPYTALQRRRTRALTLSSQWCLAQPLAYFGGDLFRPNRLQATPDRGLGWQSDRHQPGVPEPER